MEGNALGHRRDSVVYKRLINILKVNVAGNILFILIALCAWVLQKSGLLWTNAILPPSTTNRNSQVQHISFRSKATSDDIGSETVCITCSVYGKDVLTSLYDYTITTSYGVSLCCVNNDTDTQDIILQLLALPEHQYIYEGPSNQKLKWWTERDYAAHLYADHVSNARSLSWTASRHSTSFVRNLTLCADSRNKLTVPDAAGAGQYFVYSMFTFDFHNQPTSKHKPEINHCIIKNKDYPPNCFDKNRLWWSSRGNIYMSTRQTSYLSGVVSLKQSDTITVKAYSFYGTGYTTEKYIDYSSLYFNFFGMFKLD
ncbi:uncharacterized protein LOC132548992 [Ylistrum balloti]|uniref:uncharacterized protein LOC132548992 n=1 Tax=Ylistrum balloti TaxID=509963 RepID=UPI002905DA0A|nr:uncharacterized protein LOC132548992 [Ylistrum balloti]